MQKTLKKIILLIPITGFFIGICFVCVNMGLGIWEKSEEREEEVSSTGGNYSTDFSSIIENIDSNNDIVFNKLDSELFPFELPDTYPSAAWTQGNYFIVANKFFQYVGAKAVDDNTLVRSLQFNSKCEDADFGPQDMRTTLYRTGKNNGENTRVDVGFYIFPKKGLISWSEAEYFPDLTRQATINLGDIKISAEKALQIAETNGGKEARELSVNVCTIKITLYGGIYNNDWDVNYTNEKNESIFYIQIDEVTGVYKTNP
jgi:hypothetical protein